MKIENLNILKSFYSVTNRNTLTDEIFNILLKKWGLENIDLNNEMVKINAKISNLSKAQRNAIPEFIKLQSILNQKKETEENSISMNDDTTNEIITNQCQVESIAEIN